MEKTHLRWHSRFCQQRASALEYVFLNWLEVLKGAVVTKFRRGSAKGEEEPLGFQPCVGALLAKSAYFWSEQLGQNIGHCGIFNGQRGSDFPKS